MKLSNSSKKNVYSPIVGKVLKDVNRTYFPEYFTVYSVLLEPFVEEFHKKAGHI